MSKIFRTKIAAIFFCVMPFVTLVSYSRAAQPMTYSVDYQNTATLQALTDFSAQNQIPLGIVLGPDSGLCAALQRLTLKDATAETIMDNLLVNSGYDWSKTDGVFVIKPKSLPAASEHILHLKIPSFRSTETTLQGLGIMLSGVIRSTIDSSGYATSILSSSDSKTVKPFTLENMTVEQIADYIVGLNGKGAWVLEAHPYETGQMKRGRLQIYSYADDAGRLKTFPCSAQSQQ